jgi:type IV pilus assembly protein PilV
MRAHGFSLVEVLVAIFVLAVGALGALATQALAHSGSLSAVLQGRAAAIAASLAAHLEAEGGAHYLGVDYDAAAGPPARPAVSCAVANCPADAFARDALYAAQAALFADFPAGRLVICLDATVVDPADGAPAWRCDGAAGAPAAIKIGWAGAAHPAFVQLAAVQP